MGGSKTQNTQTTNEPWGAAQPALRTSINAAQSLYNHGIGSTPYTGSTVVPFSRQTTAAQGMAEHVARQGYETLSANMARIERLMADRGLTDLQRQSVDQLTPMASGAYLTRNNPFTQAVVDRTGEQMAHRIGELAGASGRYGAGAHQGVLAREIGDMANRAYQDDYNRERGYMQDAIGSVFNAGQQQRTNQIGDTRAIVDAYNARLSPTKTLYEVGSQFEDLATRQKNDELRLFNETQNAPWDNLARLNAVAGGAGRLGSSSQVQAQGPSAFQRGIGGAVAGSPFGPIGMALGGLGGLLF